MSQGGRSRAGRGEMRGKLPLGLRRSLFTRVPAGLVLPGPGWGTACRYFKERTRTGS